MTARSSQATSQSSSSVTTAGSRPSSDSRRTTVAALQQHAPRHSRAWLGGRRRRRRRARGRLNRGRPALAGGRARGQPTRHGAGGADLGHEAGMATHPRARDGGQGGGDPAGGQVARPTICDAASLFLQVVSIPGTVERTAGRAADTQAVPRRRRGAGGVTGVTQLPTRGTGTERAPSA